MSIVKYFYRGGIKTFDINQAIKDGQWPDPDKADLFVNLEVQDRSTGETAVVSKCTKDHAYGMYFVHFATGGWLCFDHAVNQYIPVNAHP